MKTLNRFTLPILSLFYAVLIIIQDGWDYFKEICSQAEDERQ